MNFLRLLSLVGVGVLLPTNALASTYVNATGKTTIVLREQTTPRRGYYFTEEQGRQYRGDIEITQTSANGGGIFYRGRFRDFAMGPGPAKACEGTIELQRSGVAPGRLQATWKVISGKSCASVGRTINMAFIEPLPRPNASGDFTANLTNTYMSETNGAVTWPKWRVTSSDGKLNCRTTPNGSTIKKVFDAKTESVSAELRGGNAIKLHQGAPWLMTRQGCYVRANTKFIQPISIPD
jgi:hypothetical protein